MTLILEVVLAALLGGLAVMIVNRLAFDALLARGRLCTPSSATVEVTTVRPANQLFTTESLCWASSITLKRGERYRITLTIVDGWLDRTERADVGGFPTATGVHFMAALLRRRWREHWFKPIAKIGCTGTDEHVLDPLRPFKPYRYPASPNVGGKRSDQIPVEKANEIVRESPTPVDRLTLVSEIRPATTGELFIYVNDAVLGLPKRAGRFYQNNRGSATVTVSKVTDDQDDSSKRSIKKKRM
jgi:hypothetical protein